MFESVRRWHIYAVAALLLLVYVFFAWQSYRTMERELTEAVKTAKLTLSQLAAVSLEEKLDSLVILGNSLASRVRFRELIAAGQWHEAAKILENVPNEFESIDRLYLADTDGVLWIDMPAMPGTVRGSSYVHHEWYQGVSKNWEPYISPVYTRTALPRVNVFAVSIPIRSVNGDLIGILVLQQEVAEFFTWIQGIDIGKGGILYVVDSRGRLAAHPDLPVSTELIDYSMEPAVQYALQGLSGITSETAGHGEQSLIAHVPDRHGWAVIVKQPEAIAFAVRDRQLTRVAIEYTVVFLIGVLLIWLMTRILLQQRQHESDQRVMARLEEQWTFFRRIIDLDNNMIFAKDREGRFVLVNKATADIFGTTVDKLIGKSNDDVIFDPESVARFSRDEQEIMDSLQEKFFPEVKIKDAEGKTRWLQTVLRPMVSEDGKAEIVLGVSADITERKRMEDELRRNIDRFEMVSRATNDAVWDLNPETGAIWWNDAFYSLFGYQRGEPDSTLDLWSDRVHPKDYQRVNDSLQKALSGTDTYWSQEYRFRNNDGSYAYVFDRGYILRDANGKVIRMIGSLMDITERHEQEYKIARLSRIRMVMSEINSMIVRIHDREELCDEACRIAVEHGGFPMVWIGLLDEETSEIRPVASHGDDKGYLQIARFSAREDIPEGQNLVSRALREKQSVISNNIAQTSGMRYQNELLERDFQSFAVLPLSIDDRVIGVFTLYSQDIDAFDEEERKLLLELVADVSFAFDHIQKEQRINYLAYYDILTGLPNRELFSDRLMQELHSTRRKHIHGLVLIDIERFAYINEALGRHIGDSVLKIFAERIKNVLPEEDHVARTAADAYAVFLTGMKSAAEMARFLEEKILPVLSEPVVIAGQQLQIAVKAGIAVLPNDGSDAETLFKNAEAALKNAKQSGARYLFYRREMNAQIAEKLELENRLRLALQKNEFVLAYQPKVDLKTNRIVGLEALIRWNSDKGMVPPDRFIPVLEETGLILDVGRWVIKKAMQDYQEWLTKGLQPPPIAVNISAIQLRQEDFVAHMDAVMQGIPDIGSRLELEITETVIMDDLEDNMTKLGKLRERGIGIGIDDFGTGYSSLRYMGRLPVTVLKIDRAFIANMMTSAEDQAIISAVIPLSHALGLIVIAEGVETMEQKTLLQDMQCDQFQGYLFSPPLFFDDITPLLQKQVN